VIDEIRSATNGIFADEVAAALGRRALPGRPGRPPTGREPDSLPLFM